jgi:cytochrome c-type biogenesis protein CcmF
VRSGVLNSVHAFASDPSRGVVILGILTFFVGGALALYAWRAPLLKAEGLFAPISREGALILNNLLLAACAAAVFIGTLYPLFLDAAGGPKITVGPPFFNMTFVPIMVPLLCLVPFGPLLGWKRADIVGALERLMGAAAAALAVGLLVLAVMSHGPWLAALGMALATWLVAGAFSELAGRIGLFSNPLSRSLAKARRLPRAQWGMVLAHGGLGIVVAGIVGMTAWRYELVTALKIGESAELAGYTLTLEKVGMRQGPNYEALVGVVGVKRGDRDLGFMLPEKRNFPVERQEKTEAAIRTNGFSDLYIVIGDNNGQGAWTLRAYENNFAPWIWAGAIIMAAGGLVSLTDRRYRVGAPSRARVRLAASPSPAE